MTKLTKLEKDISYVSALSDYPNSNDGMTSSQLKETFDKSSNDIKDFINNVLTEEIDAKTDEDANTYATKDELREAQMGQIVDGAVTLDKLAEDVQERINKIDTVEEKANYASYKVDSVEENLNETIGTLDTTKDKVENIFQYNIPTVEKIEADNTNVFTLPYNLSNLNVNQRVLIQAPSETNITGVSANMLNNIPVETLLVPNQKYELVYDGEKFVENNKVLYDITLEEAVSQIDLTGIADMFKVGKNYSFHVMGTAAENNTISLGSKAMGYLKTSQYQSIAYFTVSITNMGKVLTGVYSGSGNVAIVDSSVISNNEYIKQANNKNINVGTRFIIKEIG